MLQHVALLLRISGANRIARRYFVVNGFDGALTMLGIVTGFIVSDARDLSVVLGACLGAAIALGVSGISSAYVSESAERRRELAALEESMVADLGNSYHAAAARWIPILIALVNGFAPLTISLVIITPLWLARAGVSLVHSPLYDAVGLALGIVFLLGVYLGRIEGVSILRSGLRTVCLATATAALIYLLAGR
ncbi:MAG: hypothetical protein DWQ08_15465 [Proteobacteria bacterium]|nr:MAG: hypothetical protein DWQ08_15465 [Pseudomonadota bacterium]